MSSPLSNTASFVLCVYTRSAVEYGVRAACCRMRPWTPTPGWKINYPEIGYPEFCQLIEQNNIDPNKALGQGIKITVAIQFEFCVV